MISWMRIRLGFRLEIRKIRMKKQLQVICSCLFLEGVPVSCLTGKSMK